MSLKRILGMVLASRMAGRGRRRSSMGAAGMLGGLGYRRRSGLAGKAGLAGLGYMAYKAYRDHQASTAQSQTAQGQTTTSGPRPSGGNPAGGSGGIGGMVQDLIDKVSAVAAPAGADNQNQRPAAQSEPETEPSEADLQQDAAAADRIDDDRALLLLRAMITAAHADGAMSAEEREQIMAHITESGATEDDRRVMEREIANPKSLDDLLTQVNEAETAEEFYLASSAAVDSETETNAAYLETVRQRLLISKEDAREIDELTA